MRLTVEGQAIKMVSRLAKTSPWTTLGLVVGVLFLLFGVLNIVLRGFPGDVLEVTPLAFGLILVCGSISELIRSDHLKLAAALRFAASLIAIAFILTVGGPSAPLMAMIVVIGVIADAWRYRSRRLHAPTDDADTQILKGPHQPGKM